MSGKQKKRERMALREKLIFLEKEANLGNADAQVSLGYMYCERSALEPMDLKKAFYWLKKAADQDHEEGLMCMADFYMQGDVVEKDVRMCAKYLYVYNKKINSDNYKQSIERGLGEEEFIDYIEWQVNMKNTFLDRLNDIGIDHTNSDMI